MEAERAPASTALLRVAREARVADFAQRPSVGEHGRPDRTLTIFDELVDGASRERVVSSEAPVLPTGEASIHPDPERAVAGDEQADDGRGLERLVWWRLPRDSPHAIEAKEAELGTEPQIAARRLGDRQNSSLDKAVANPPGRVNVLARVECRIQRKRRTARCKEFADQYCAEHNAA